MALDRSRLKTLDAEEIVRYSRHLVLPDVGAEGQLRLRDAAVLIVGVGGLGSPAALYLAAAGVGRLGLVDPDRVAASNLQRQVLFATEDVGRAKVEAAFERLRGINPRVKVDRLPLRFDATNGSELLRSYDLALDCADNFPTRYLVNDACALQGKPNVHGSVFRFEGQLSLFHAGHAPCYRCLYPVPPAPGTVPDCSEAGVLGVLPGVVGTLQAVEAIKQILGKGESLAGRLLLFNALEMRFREVALRRHPDCPLCGRRPTIRSLAGAAEACTSSDRSVPGEDAPPFHVEPGELKARLQSDCPPFVLDVRTAAEWEICRLAEARLLPLDELSSRLDELPRDAEIVVYCHVGIRSALAVRLLRGHGFVQARNLAGGILAWATEVEPEMPRY